jgi:hypothetical protein
VPGKEGPSAPRFQPLRTAAFDLFAVVEQPSGRPVVTARQAGAQRRQRRLGIAQAAVGAGKPEGHLPLGRVQRLSLARKRHYAAVVAGGEQGVRGRAQRLKAGRRRALLAGPIDGGPTCWQRSGPPVSPHLCDPWCAAQRQRVYTV